MLYRQAHTRGRPTLIEANLAIPPNSIIRIMIDVDRAYLRYTDYPPDPARGFDVPSGIILSKEEEDGLNSGRRIYTTSTLLDMPEPDFSMPYNVIILTCKFDEGIVLKAVLIADSLSLHCHQVPSLLFSSVASLI